MQDISVHLRRQDFTDKPHEIASTDGLTVTAFRYATGVEALMIENQRGHLIVLPYMGQMVWGAEFDGVDLTMGNSFVMPRPAKTIAETYGCFAFHSGLLRNGVPSAQDTHAAHGEMPCATMDSAGLIFGEDEQGAYVEVTGEYEYVMGFGAHYLARPSVRLYADDTLFDIEMDVENLSYAPMDLMYMCHVNFAYEEDARIVQPTSFSPEDTKVRTAMPAHVTPNPDYLALIDALATDPAVMEVLDDPDRYDPEQVFYLRNLKQDDNGIIHQMMRLEQGKLLPFPIRQLISRNACVGFWSMVMRRLQLLRCHRPANRRAIWQRRPKAMCACWLRGNVQASLSASAIWHRQKLTNLSR